MDWFKWKLQETHHISWENLQESQSIDWRCCFTFILTFLTARYPHVYNSSRSGLMLSYSRQNSYQKSSNGMAGTTTGQRGLTEKAFTFIQGGYGFDQIVCVQWVNPIVVIITICLTALLMINNHHHVLLLPFLLVFSFLLGGVTLQDLELLHINSYSLWVHKWNVILYIHVISCIHLEVSLLKWG